MWPRRIYIILLSTFFLLAVATAHYAMTEYKDGQHFSLISKCGHVEYTITVIDNDYQSKKTFTEFKRNQVYSNDGTFNQHISNVIRSMDSIFKEIRLRDRTENDLQPFKLDVVFAKDLPGSIEINEYDPFFGRVRIDTPWIRYIEYPWDSCRGRAIFLSQAGQIAADKMRMSQPIGPIGKIKTVNKQQFNSYIAVYENNVLNKGLYGSYRMKSVNSLNGRIPGQILWILASSPQSSIGPFSYEAYENARKLIYSTLGQYEILYTNALKKYLLQRTGYIKTSDICSSVDTGINCKI